MTVADPQSSSRTPIKVGLLGAGYILQAHAKALAGCSGVMVNAVCDISRERAEEAAETFGIPHVFTDIEALAASDCEVVHVLVPPQLHVEVARRLLEAGKSVFLEKPMGIGAEACAQLVELAKARGLRIGVNHNFLFLPGYERLREELHNGTLGRPDHLTVNWLYPLGLLQFGPYNNWMLREEGNLVFELGPHLAAFVVDLLGPPDELVAMASHPIDLPGAQRVWRHWNAVGRKGETSLAINLSVAPGQAERSLHLRCHAGSAHLDFERDFYARQATASTSAVFDPFLAGTRDASGLIVQSVRNLAKTVGGTLRKAATSNAFQESILRSVAAFYRGYRDTPDPRLEGSFGVEVMRLCERIVADAKVMTASSVPRTEAVSAIAAQAPPRPTVLVVGGTGFIGKRLVRALVAKGVGVRVLSRSTASAQLELAGLAVDVVQGTHDDPAALDRALDGIEVVYHLAKATGKRWDDYVKNDVEPTRVLAEAALRHGVRRFIYTGTIDSYDSGDASKVIDGNTPLDPRIEERNHYARSKATCEALLMKMHRERGLPLVIFRPGVVIGAGSPPAHWGVGMFHSDTRVQYWGDGRTKLPLVLVDDVAHALMLGMDVPGIEGDAFLLTDAPHLSAREYVAETAKATGSAIHEEPTPIWRFYLLDALKEVAKHAIAHPNRRRAVYRDWDCRAHRSRYDNTRTRQMLGWTPAGTREALVTDGIVAAVRHYMR
ncbi:MAG: NAD-dependent epimerase/dehydratase family protein [Caldimonas sp.]